MSMIVPLISSGLAGPLGVLHLPRLWLKISLDAHGKLAKDYPAVGTGFDQLVLDGLGLDKAKTVAYIQAEKPTYPQFEAWIKQQPGVKLEAAAIEGLNQTIRGYNHSDDTRAEILGANGLTDETCAFRDAVNLNNLDDWKGFYDAELK